MTAQFSWPVGALLAASAPAHGAVRLWAASDGVRIRPTDGRVLEARPDIHRDYPGGGFRGGNMVWNAATHTVTLHAGRNEFTAFQAIVETDRPCEQEKNSGCGSNTFLDLDLHLQKRSLGEDSSFLKSSTW